MRLSIGAILAFLLVASPHLHHSPGGHAGCTASMYRGGADERQERHGSHRHRRESGKGSVAEMYLTDGKNDIKVVMTEQTPTQIKCKIPAKVEAGPLQADGADQGQGTEADRTTGSGRSRRVIE